MFHGDVSPFLEARQAGDGAMLESVNVPFSRGSRLFQDLDNTHIDMLPEADGQRSTRRTKEALEDITSCMVGPNDREAMPDALSTTPAAFTYFGQFVFHDIVFSRVFGLPPGIGQTHHLKNAVSFGLDMSGLYGRGPSIDGHLYDAPTRDKPGTCRFPLGLPCARGSKQPVDATVEKGRDLPRIDMGSSFISAEGRRTAYRPLVADPRNDDNLVLSQLLATLMRTHNRLVDVQLANGVNNANVAYDNAKIFLTGAYRRAVIHDYLKRILHPRIWTLFFKATDDFQGPMVEKLHVLRGLPIEFTFAASRFAHAMVRQSYRINEEFDVEPGRLEDLLTFSSQREEGDVPVPVKWIVDWRRFAGDERNVQHARRISPFLSSALTHTQFKLTKDGDQPRSVAFMDCWRCYDLQLPTGQTVAIELERVLRESGIADPALSVLALSGDAMLPTAACRRRYPASAAALTSALQRAPEFLTATPLFYYILQEASADEEGGNRLGFVGSYIVGATVAASLFLAPDSEVRAEKVNAGEIRTLEDMLALHDPDRKTDRELMTLLS